MKREIKFRLWNGKDSFCTEEHVKCNLFNYLKFNPEYVQQYTGLKDKNGVEIYEKDILLCDNGNRFTCDWNEDKARWELNSLSAKRGIVMETPVDDLTVIGNIFSNPELLNEK